MIESQFFNRSRSIFCRVIFFLLPGFYHFFMFLRCSLCGCHLSPSPPFFSVSSRCSCHSCNFFFFSFFSIRFLCASFFFVAGISFFFFQYPFLIPLLLQIFPFQLSRAATFIARSPFFNISCLFRPWQLHATIYIYNLFPFLFRSCKIATRIENFSRHKNSESTYLDSFQISNFDLRKAHGCNFREMKK